MAGGTWTTQNKVRSGAYFNIKSTGQNTIVTGDRGVLTFPIGLSWGEGIIELTPNDFVSGSATDKIGYGLGEEESLIFREALKYTNRLLVYRLDVGGTKATRTITFNATEDNPTGNPVTVTSKYSGILGNQVAFAIEQGYNNTLEAITYFKGAEKERVKVQYIKDLADNGYLTFAYDNTIADLPIGEVIALGNLSGGTNGSVDTQSYENYYRAIQNKVFDTMAIPSLEVPVITSAVMFINDLDANSNLSPQLVVHNYNADNNELVISLYENMGYKLEDVEVDTTVAIVMLGAMMSGAQVNQSNTYKVIIGATDIVNELTQDEIIQAIQNGHVVFTRRSDGAIVIEKDINTLHQFSADKSNIFSKNRVIRVLSSIRRNIGQTFEMFYIGKVNNNEQGRNLFKTSVISYMRTLEELGAIQNFDSTQDITIRQGNDIDSVVCELWVQPVDSMEKLYMSIMVGTSNE